MSTRTEFAAALSALRERAGLTVRALGRRLDIPAATLGGWFSGRHVPSPAQVPLLRTVLAACGVVDPVETEQWLAALHRARGASDRRLSRPPAPYRGLTAFEPDDAALFFGRDAEVADILDRLAALRRDRGPSGGVLAVIGPSGSGKSSLLRAGVVAAVRAGRLPDGVPCVVTTPGPDPQDALARALEQRPRVLVIDQFEELFTAAVDQERRAAFLRALAGRDPAVPVVLGMRADFYGAAAGEPALLPALQHAQVLLGPMSAAQLREAIVRPAEQVGATVDEALAELVLADLAPHDAAGRAHDPGALPLLSHALLATWERAAGGRLTVAEYRATGGIDAAVQRTAEQVYTDLGPAGQDLARRIFVRLVNLDDAVAVTRRRGSRAELEQLEAGGDAGAAAVVDRFVERRLLTAHRDYVEITHEALLSAWPRLRGWLDADRAGLRLQRQITDAAAAWQEAGRDPALLWRGGRLEAAAERAQEGGPHRAELSPSERDFVDTGVATAAAERARDRRRSRRLKQLLAVAAVLALVAAGLAAYALDARSIADRNRRAAGIARDDALSRQVAQQAHELATADPALAEQLALVAYRLAPTAQARGAVVDESAQPVITRTLGALGPTALAADTGRALLAVGHADDGSVHLYAARDGRAPRPVGTVPGPGTGAQVFALAFAPGGRMLATGGEQHDVQLWDVADPSRPRRIATLRTGFTGAVEAIAISPDGRTLVAGSRGPRPVLAWDIHDPAAATPRPAPPVPAGLTLAQSLAFSPDGRRLAAGGDDGDVLIWPADRLASNPATATVPGGPAATVVNAVRFAPGGQLLYAADTTGTVRAWTVTARPAAAHAWTGTTNAQVSALAVAPDGRTVTIGRSDNTLQQLDAGLAPTSGPINNPGPVTGVAYLGRTLYWTAADGTLRAEPADARGIPVTGSVFNLVYSRHGDRLAVVRNGAGAGVQLWDVRHPSTPRLLGPLIALPQHIDGSGSMSGDGRLVAAGTAGGQVGLWDTADPAHPRALGPPLTTAGAAVESIAFSPDGRRLGVADDDGTLSLWDIADPARPRRLAVLRRSNLMLSLAFSPDGRLVAGADAEGDAVLWDIGDPAHPRLRAVLGGFKSYVYGVAFSPDGRLVAVSSADHTTRLWDVSRPGRARPVGPPMIGPTDYVYNVAFNRDGSLLATASNDSDVRLYDVRHPSELPLETLRGLGGPAFVATFSPDGRRIVAGGRAGEVAGWSLDPADYARRLCPLAGDPITRAEWAEYVPGARYAPPCRPASR